jgi:hypothetical protein
MASELHFCEVRMGVWHLQFAVSDQSFRAPSMSIIIIIIIIRWNYEQFFLQQSTRVW